jgi:hypothetical protein
MSGSEWLEGARAGEPRRPAVGNPGPSSGFLERSEIRCRRDLFSLNFFNRSAPAPFAYEIRRPSRPHHVSDHGLRNFQERDHPALGQYIRMSLSVASAGGTNADTAVVSRTPCGSRVPLLLACRENHLSLGEGEDQLLIRPLLILAIFWSRHQPSTVARAT